MDHDAISGPVALKMPKDKAKAKAKKKELQDSDSDSGERHHPQRGERPAFRAWAEGCPPKVKGACVCVRCECSRYGW